jgi:hypothetical protein
MTPQHIRNMTLRYLSQMGIRVGGSKTQQAAMGPEIRFVGRSATGRGDDPASSRRVENSRGFLAAKELVYDAIMRRATDVHLEPKEDEFGVRLRIDGVMYPTEGFDRGIGDAVLNIFKVLGAIPKSGVPRTAVSGRSCLTVRLTFVWPARERVTAKK